MLIRWLGERGGQGVRRRGEGKGEGGERRGERGLGRVKKREKVIFGRGGMSRYICRHLKRGLFFFSNTHSIPQFKNGIP